MQHEKVQKIITYCAALLLILASASAWAQSSERLQKDEEERQRDEKPQRNIYRQGADRFAESAHLEQTNAQTWFNYYSSARFGAYSKTSNVIDATEQNELDSIVLAMEDNVPHSYEYHYVKYWNGRYDPALFNHLETAAQLRPNSVELYDDFIAHYEISGQDKKKDEYCKKWHAAGAISNEVYSYNRNVLVGLPRNAILITNGETDTYPLWILQSVENVRPDVQVLNLNLLQRDGYRTKRLHELGLKSSTAYDVANPKHFLLDLGQQNPQARLHLGLTVAPAILTYLQHNLYLTGLAFEYSDNGVDNLAQLEKNWEKKFDLDYLDQRTPDDESARLHMNYVLPAVLLHQHYTDEGNSAKTNELKALVEQVAKQAGRSEEVAPLLRR